MADDTSPPQETKAGAAKRFARDIASISKFNQRLLMFFLTVAVVGGAMWTWSYVTAEPPKPAKVESSASSEPTAPTMSVKTPDGAPALLEGDTDLGDDVSDEPITPPASVSTIDWKGKLGLWMARLGLSFVGGLLVGVFFRIYLKTMAVLAAIATAGIVGLSYFQIIDIDFTFMKDNYESASGWVGEQADRAKDLVMGIFPSMVASVIGFFVGLLKK